MPELPEVETTCRGIEPWVVGQRIRAAHVRDGRLRWGVDAAIATHVRGRVIRAVDRRAKYLLLRLDSGDDLIVHLGMSGRLRILVAPENPGRHDHFDLELDNGHALRLTDPRRFGAVLWAPAGAERHARLLDLGPEPLSDAFDGDVLHAATEGRRAPIKQVLMDAAVVVGVGNIYANEALFLAGIRPGTAARRLSRPRCRRLAAAVKEVLQRAIAAGGTSFRDFVGSDGKPGYFEQSLNVYGREDQPCRTCGAALVGTRLGGRATVHCRTCQRP
jgi:formamidopyrimidine-DNA glycosylase